MKFAFATAVKPEKGNEYIIDLADIHVDHGANNRYAQADTDILVQSISQFGQLESVGVVRVKPHNTLKLAYGFGRYEAIKRINESLPDDQKMKIRVTVFDGNDHDVFVRNLAENAHRNNLTHMDYALAIRKMGDLYNQSDTQISNFFGRTTSWLSQHRSLISLDHTVQGKLHAGEISFSDALSLTKVSLEKQREIVAAAVAEYPDAPPSPAATENEDAPGAKKEDSPAEEPIVPAVKKEKASIKKLVKGVTGGKTKRTMGEMNQFFQIMIGSPVISEKLQQLSQVMLAIMSGELDSDAEAVSAIEVVLGVDGQ